VAAQLPAAEATQQFRIGMSLDRRSRHHSISDSFFGTRRSFSEDHARDLLSLYQHRLPLQESKVLLL
jgi:hypothetical protein